MLLEVGVINIADGMGSDVGRITGATVFDGACSVNGRVDVVCPGMLFVGITVEHPTMAMKNIVRVYFIYLMTRMICPLLNGILLTTNMN